MNDTSEVLNRSADLIQERGWIKGCGWVMERSVPDAPLCLEGGIMAAIGLRIPMFTGSDIAFDALVTCPAYRAVVSYLDREEVSVASSGVGFNGEPLYWWNDESSRTAEEVIELLRAVAVIEAAKENIDTRELVDV